MAPAVDPDAAEAGPALCGAGRPPRRTGDHCAQLKRDVLKSKSLPGFHEGSLRCGDR
jgi:hypothetical protein